MLRHFYILLPILFLIIGGFSGLHAQAWQWVRDAGGSQNDPVGGVAVDSVGNTYVVGTFQGNIAFGPSLFTNGTNIGLYLAKYGPTGNLLWAKAGTGPGNVREPAIAVNPEGDIFITGAFVGRVVVQSDTLASTGGFDVFVARFNTDGLIQWTQRGTGLSNAYGRGIALDNFDNIAIAGYFDGDVHFGPNDVLVSAGGHDVFVARFGPTGAYKNSGRAGGAFNEEAHAIGIDGSGNSIIAGQFSGSTLFGSTTLTSAGGTDIFVARFNSLGQSIVGGRVGGPGNDSALASAVDRFGNSYVTGSFADSILVAGSMLVSAGGSDVFVGKFDTFGVSRWGMRGGGPGADAGYGVAIDPLGDVYATGQYRDSAVFGSVALDDTSGTGDIFVAKYSTTGSLIWIRSAGGTDADAGMAIAVDRGDELRVAGGYSGRARIGAFDLVSSGAADLFVGKLGADPTIITGAIASNRFCAGDDLYVNFSTKGVFELGNVFTAQLSDSAGDFSNPIPLGSVVNIYPALITATIPDSVRSGRGYRVRVVSSKPVALGSPNSSNIIIDPAPGATILSSGPVEFCRGDSVVLDAGEGFSSYRWNSGATTRRITVTQPGEYRVTVAFPTGCTGISAPVRVTVFSPAKPPIVRTGSTLETGAAVAYEWTLNGTPVPGATGRSYTPVQGGAYRVRITDSNGCSAISDPYQFNLAGVSIESARERIAVYPHPNDGAFTVEMSLKHGGALQGELVNALGERVAGWDDIAGPGLYRHQLDIAPLPAGLYFLRLDAEGESLTREVVKR